ncbi:MAG: flavodoxin-dependent (E)-4-hydroxy-3-methylbut-2-enyl-diphosphate synthase, partial [Bacteroidales bacterium]|nr:flavodoxin-dependent (E)-4-hydroxy-3-methylbut-2-enyl-diphosphate synthase [Bacteroidales bacterium]
GRIKSAAGIGTLLSEGIGDTIRVSLTEAPENEIPVARQIASFFSKKNIYPVDKSGQQTGTGLGLLLDFHRRISRHVGSIGAGNVPVVLWENDGVNSLNEYHQIEGNDGRWITPLQNTSVESNGKIHYVLVDPVGDDFTESRLHDLARISNAVLVFKSSTSESIRTMRERVHTLDGLGLDLPVAIFFESQEPDPVVFAVDAALRCAPLLIDGQCDGIFLKNKNLTPAQVVEIAFGILQSTRARITQNEYIACPGCGRTRYDLEGALERVKRATSNLKGLKIAVMGCIVNGPGEMADADYGYVGQGHGKVTLYKGNTAVQKNIPEGEAVDALIRLMQEHEHWQER